MTLNELITRKTKADTLPEDIRVKYAAEYADICDQIQGKLIDIAMACDKYAFTFQANPEDIDALIPAARAIASELSRIGVDLLEEGT